MSDLPMKQENHPAHNMPKPMYSGTELGILKLKNAMSGSQEDDGSYNYRDSMYNAQRARAGISTDLDKTDD